MNNNSKYPGNRNPWCDDPKCPVNRNHVHAVEKDMETEE